MHESATPVVIDNRSRKVGEALREHITPNATLSIVSAWFTIYAFGELRAALESISAVRFLYGDPLAIGEVDPTTSAFKFFRLTDDNGIELAQTLTQKPLAEACAQWIKQKVEIRAITQAGFLHGKLYCVQPADSASAADSAIIGSSNFTKRGLGWGAAPNIELNIEVRNPAERAELRQWFDDLWNDQTLTEDAKPAVLAALERLGAPCSPQFIYYKTLFHIFERQRIEYDDGVDQFSKDLHQTAIWKALYAFQKQGAVNIINRLLKHRGCILADSVGLGKTWTALAAIKYFEDRNERVLVLCPKRLKQNWQRYAAHAASRHNPFIDDRFAYTILSRINSAW